MKLILEKKENGCVITINTTVNHIKEDRQFTETETRSLVVEQSGTEDEHIKDVLQLIAGEFFFYNYNKFSKNNLNITFDKKGNKVE